MESKRKLDEARYFLGSLEHTTEDGEEFYYNLGAFLNSWRSVLDIMPYDFAEKYQLGFTRDDRVEDYEFQMASRALNHTNALKFLKWWRQQVGKIQIDPLSRKRIDIVHHGYPEKVYIDYTCLMLLR